MAYRCFYEEQGKGTKRHRLPCQLSESNGKCCWCMDERSDREIEHVTIYMDGHGHVKPIDYRIKMKRDLWYCTRCKVTNSTDTKVREIMHKAIKL